MGELSQKRHGLKAEVNYCAIDRNISKKEKIFLEKYINRGNEQWAVHLSA